MSALLRLCTVALIAFTAACGPQTFVEIDTASEGSFTVADPAPTVRPYLDGAIVVLSEEQGEQLALVTIELPEINTLQEGEAVDIEDAGIAMVASRGDLEVIEREDGTRVINSQDARRFSATSGTFTLDQRAPLAGSFVVELEDGGLLSGTFVTR